MRKSKTRPAQLLLACAISLLPGSLLATPIADTLYSPSPLKPTFTENRPVVLFDEGHNNFHTSTVGYLPFARLIGSDGYVVTPVSGKFDSHVLQRGQILVIVNPSGVEDNKDTTPREMDRSAFSDDECAAIQQWVSKGGNLLLVADHYPFGGAAGLLAERFGVQMGDAWVNDDSTFEKKADGEVFSRANGLLRSTPITEGRSAGERINRIATYTGQILITDHKRDIFVFGPHAVAEFPPDRKIKESAAGKAQGVAFGFGKGRVVILGEAAMLTSQWSGQPPEGLRWGGLVHPELDNTQLALNIMHWLSHLYR